MKQGELVIKHEKVNIRSLISDVFDITQTLVTKHVKLINEVHNMPSTIVADGDRLIQIMYNLIGNAGVEYVWYEAVMAFPFDFALTAK